MKGGVEHRAGRPVHCRDGVRHLAIAIRSAIGIEAYVWLTDVAGLSADDAATLMRWSARAMLAAARAEIANSATP